MKKSHPCHSHLCSQSLFYLNEYLVKVWVYLIQQYTVQLIAYNYKHPITHNLFLIKI